jgi:hypothetical protein
MCSAPGVEAEFLSSAGEEIADRRQCQGELASHSRQQGVQSRGSETPVTSWSIFIDPIGASISVSASSWMWDCCFAIKRRDELAEIQLSQINALGPGDVNHTLRRFPLTDDA